MTIKEPPPEPGGPRSSSPTSNTSGTFSEVPAAPIALRPAASPANMAGPRPWLSLTKNEVPSSMKYVYAELHPDDPTSAFFATAFPVSRRSHASGPAAVARDTLGPRPRGAGVGRAGMPRSRVDPRQQPLPPAAAADRLGLDPLIPCLTSLSVPCVPRPFPLPCGSLCVGDDDLAAAVGVGGAGTHLTRG